MLFNEGRIVDAEAAAPEHLGDRDAVGGAVNQPDGLAGPRVEREPAQLEDDAVEEFAQELALELGYEEGLALEELRAGALLHDLGKIAIPDAILDPYPEDWADMEVPPGADLRAHQPRLARCGANLGFTIVVMTHS